jgi:hypothetical protein
MKIQGGNMSATKVMKVIKVVGKVVSGIQRFADAYKTIGNGN